MSTEEFFADLSLLTRLLLAVGPSSALDGLPADIRLRFDRYVQQRKMRAQGRGVHGWIHDQLEGSSRLTAAVVTQATQIMGMERGEAAEAVSWIRANRGLGAARHHVDRLGCSKGMDSMLAEMAAGSGRGGRWLFGPVRALRLEQRHIPSLMWASVFDDRFATLFAPARDVQSRRFASVALMAVTSGLSIHAAAELLKAQNHSILSATAGWSRDRKRLLQAKMIELVRELDRQPNLVDYEKRWQRLTAFRRLPMGAWDRVLASSGVSFNELASGADAPRLASVWIWAEFVCERPNVAPGWMPGGSHSGGPFRRFLRRDLPALERELVRYARQLLGDVGDHEK